MEGICDYTLTMEQAEAICKAVGVDIRTLENWELGELIDKFIDDEIELIEKQ